MKPVKTRRAFIKTGAAALCGLAAAPALAAKPRKSAEWAETFDVIVIGSGLAAFVAGLSALENGAAARSRRPRASRTAPRPCSETSSRRARASAIPI